MNVVLLFFLLLQIVESVSARMIALVMDSVLTLCAIANLDLVALIAAHHNAPTIALAMEHVTMGPASARATTVEWTAP